MPRGSPLDRARGVNGVRDLNCKLTCQHTFHYIGWRYLLRKTQALAGFYFVKRFTLFHSVSRRASRGDIRGRRRIVGSAGLAYALVGRR